MTLGTAVVAKPAEPAGYTLAIVPKPAKRRTNLIPPPVTVYHRLSNASEKNKNQGIDSTPNACAIVGMHPRAKALFFKDR